MNVLLLPEAREEFLGAVTYYRDGGGNSLARRFKEETERCIGLIGSHHEHFRLRPRGYRRVNMKVFPYYLPFIVRGSIVWVLAVAHASQEPEYWVERKPAN